MERRNFIKSCSILCASTLGVSTLLQSCKSTFYIPNSFDANRIVIKKADFLENKFVLVKNEKLQAPIYLTKHSDTDFSAVLMLCTHKGCELSTAGNYLVCPCHGSEFSNVGKVLNPPAEKDLEKFAITTDASFIYIQL